MIDKENTTLEDKVTWKLAEKLTKTFSDLAQEQGFDTESVAESMTFFLLMVGLNAGIGGSRLELEDCRCEWNVDEIDEG